MQCGKTRGQILPVMTEQTRLVRKFLCGSSSLLTKFCVYELVAQVSIHLVFNLKLLLRKVNYSLVVRCCDFFVRRI